jgi:two-component system, chemotaxis family, sensor kinase CheA
MEDFSKEEMEQLMSVFRDQSLQILEDMCQDILALESQGWSDEVVSRLRRAAHTMKGDSACIGLDRVTDLAHKVEDVIAEVVGGRLDFEAGVVDAMLDVLDAVRGVLQREEVSDVEPRVAAELSRRLGGLLLASHAADVAADKPGPQFAEENVDIVNVEVVNVEVVGEGARQKVAAQKPAGRSGQIRIDAARVDALLNLAGEMVIARSMLGQVTGEMESALGRGEMTTKLALASAQLGKLIAELQKGALRMRMVPIGTLFKRFARPMRELALERGKEVELSLSGEETELDRTLVDSIYEPILHLLRNAVDHGLEPTDERRAAGKSAAGSISLRACHEGNRVVIEIGDDGRGIDTGLLRSKAVEAGAVTQLQAEAMTEEEALDLMFLQGISTARAITWVSGRGIGAAAVKESVEQMRGSISVKTEAGRGTVFTLRMPLTLAIVRALLFSASGQLLALPLLSVEEIARARMDEIVDFDGFESYRLRDRFISVVRPGQVMGFERRHGGSGAGLRRESDHVFIIVMTVGSRRYGLVADSLVGEQEVVIKPLESEWVRNEALTGASVLGDGRVVLIMDAGMLLRKATKVERTRGEGWCAYGR